MSVDIAMCIEVEGYFIMYSVLWVARVHCTNIMLTGLHVQTPTLQLQIFLLFITNEPITNSIAFWECVE